MSQLANIRGQADVELNLKTQDGAVALAGIRAARYKIKSWKKKNY